MTRESSPEGDANSNASLVKRLREEDCPSRWADDISACDADRLEAADAISLLSEQVEKQGKVVEAAKVVYDWVKTGGSRDVDTLAVLSFNVEELGAALNGLVVVGAPRVLHAPEARDGVADERASHLRNEPAGQ